MRCFIDAVSESISVESVKKDIFRSNRLGKALKNVHYMMQTQFQRDEKISMRQRIVKRICDYKMAWLIRKLGIKKV